MATTNITRTTSQTTDQPCPCGCAPCEGVCCSLDCLEQPRFFCGQLLTDQDLTALLRWTQDKLRLGRFRGGWGVVCGLDVRCDTQSRSHVIVGPGYAVSDCGDDIIACEEMRADDLRRMCVTPDTVCANPDYWNAADDGEEVAMVDLAGMQVPADELRIFDLYLSYAEELSKPQTALGRNVCGQSALCDYSRTREVSRLTWHAVDPDTDPQESISRKWEQGYLHIFEQIDTMSWDALGKAIKTQPVQKFCFLTDWLNQPAENGYDLDTAKFWLLQDRLHAYLSRACSSSHNSPGVPIARVWLQIDQTEASLSCVILLIDTMPPFRREYGPAAWPAPDGHVNLGQFIGRRYADVCRSFGHYGVQVRQRKWVEPSYGQVREVLGNQVLFAGCEDQLTAVVYEVAGKDQRIVGFTGRYNKYNGA